MQISDRLKMLGVHLGHSPESARLSQMNNEKNLLPWPVEKVIPGHDHITEFGPAYITHKSFALDYVHGGVRLDTVSKLNMMATWGKSTRLSALGKSQIAFLDTETSGLAGGTGTYAFLVGLGFFDETGFTVTQYFMRDPSTEPALLAALTERMAAFEAVVTFNGKSFDIPLLNTRFLMNRFPPPFGELDHIDLLHLARRLWRNRLASRAMGDLEKEILGFIRDQDEVPGYLIPQYYFDYLAVVMPAPWLVFSTTTFLISFLWPLYLNICLAYWTILKIRTFIRSMWSPLPGYMRKMGDWKKPPIYMRPG